MQAIERVKNLIYFFLPFSESAVRKCPLTCSPDIIKMFELGSSDLSWYDFAQKTRILADLKMALFTKIGPAFERSMLDEYKRLKPEMSSEQYQKMYKAGGFGRVLAGERKTVQKLFDEVEVPISGLPEFSIVQEYYVHRNLYAHQNAVVDTIYIEQLERIAELGDVAQQLVRLKTKSQACKGEEFYWDEPLERINVFVGAAWSVHNYVSSFKF